jgi:hypothetical protein
VSQRVTLHQFPTLAWKAISHSERQIQASEGSNSSPYDFILCIRYFLIEADRHVSDMNDATLMERHQIEALADRATVLHGRVNNMDPKLCVQAKSVKNRLWEFRRSI